MTRITPQHFVDLFRQSSPYINAHRGRTFVVLFGGEAVADAGFPNLVHDFALLTSLGVRLVLVHGARPQIEERLKARGAGIRYENGLRITDDEALACVKEAAGAVRVEIEARFSMGLANTPMSGARVRVASGNFVTAQPLGVREGVDYLHTGEVRRIDGDGIRQRLDDGAVVLIPPLGYSPTGEVFNITAEEIATATAVTLKADKLLFVTEGRGVLDARRRLIQQLTLREAEELLHGRRRLPDDVRSHLESAVLACRGQVRRVHLVGRKIDGALLQELFTRDGIGTLVSAEDYESLRPANIDDVGGVLELIAPLESQGVLVRRSRERLEQEIDHFTVIERDGMIVACGALYPCRQDRIGELACLAVHNDYRGRGHGDTLLGHLEQKAVALGLENLFVLTTHTAHWFRERGFQPADLAALPVKRRALYNYQRRSKVFLKTLRA